MSRLALSAGAFALLAAFSLAPYAKETKSVSSEAQIVCKDGTTSEAKHMRGACSGHGGVDKTSASSSASTGERDRSSDATAKSESKHTRVLGAAGAGKVWVNESTKVYHCAGDRWYGKTKRGEYMSESEAKDKGFHPDHGKACADRAK